MVSSFLVEAPSGLVPEDGAAASVLAFPEGAGLRSLQANNISHAVATIKVCRPMENLLEDVLKIISSQTL
jgi:hypothetical protein